MVLEVENSNEFINLLLENMQKFGISYKVKQKEKNESQNSIDIKKVEEDITEYEEIVNKDPNKSNIDCLMDLYAKAVEFYSICGDPKYEYYTSKIHSTLTSPRMNDFLSSDKDKISNNNLQPEEKLNDIQQNEEPQKSNDNTKSVEVPKELEKEKQENSSIKEEKERIEKDILQKAEQQENPILNEKIEKIEKEILKKEDHLEVKTSSTEVKREETIKEVKVQTTEIKNEEVGIKIVLSNNEKFDDVLDDEEEEDEEEDDA